MQPASSARLRDGSMAARRHGAEKPHQGVSTRNRALHRGFSRCKSRNALGLRAVEPKTRVRSFCSGEQYDPDLGLYYLRARYYNPATGRFMSRDPLDGNTTDPRTLRKYLYVGGDPVNGIDPRGREEQVEDTSLTARIAKVPFTVSCLIHDALVGFLFGWDSAKFGIVGFGCAVLGTLGY